MLQLACFPTRESHIHPVSMYVSVCVQGAAESVLILCSPFTSSPFPPPIYLHHLHHLCVSYPNSGTQYLNPEGAAIPDPIHGHSCKNVSTRPQNTWPQNTSAQESTAAPGSQHIQLKLPDPALWALVTPPGQPSFHTSSLPHSFRSVWELTGPCHAALNALPREPD